MTRKDAITASKTHAYTDDLAAADMSTHQGGKEENKTLASRIPTEIRVAVQNLQHGQRRTVTHVSGSALTVLKKSSMIGLVTASRCLMIHGPRLAAAVAPPTILSVKVAFSWTRRFGAILWRADSGIWSPVERCQCMLNTPGVHAQHAKSARTIENIG